MINKTEEIDLPTTAHEDNNHSKKDNNSENAGDNNNNCWPLVQRFVRRHNRCR